MMAYIVRRLWQILPTMAGVILLIFFLFNVVGGDPAYLLAGKISNPEQIANIRKQLGIDEPYWVQLLIFVKQVVTFDFGSSWSTNEVVSQIFATRLPASLMIGIPLSIRERATHIRDCQCDAHRNDRLQNQQRNADHQRRRQAGCKDARHHLVGAPA